MRDLVDQLSKTLCPVQLHTLLQAPTSPSFLPFQAVDDIHALKDALYKEEGRVRGLVDQLSKMSAKLEDLYDENSLLRKKAGLGEDDRVDIRDVRAQKEAAITQLRSLNALLERQVCWGKAGRGQGWERGEHIA